MNPLEIVQDLVMSFGISASWTGRRESLVGQWVGQAPPNASNNAATSESRVASACTRAITAVK
jgi:hypothetical protein